MYLERVNMFTRSVLLLKYTFIENCTPDEHLIRKEIHSHTRMPIKREGRLSRDGFVGNHVSVTMVVLHDSTFHKVVLKRLQSDAHSGCPLCRPAYTLALMLSPVDRNLRRVFRTC